MLGRLVGFVEGLLEVEVWKFNGRSTWERRGGEK